MDFISSHFGYITLTLTSGVIIGWMTYPLFQTTIKPALRTLRKVLNS